MVISASREGTWAADRLAQAVHDEDASLLAAWQSAVEGECPPDFDFLIACPIRTRRDDLARQLLERHCDVGDRPLVLGPMSLSAPIIDTALRCGIAGTIAQVGEQVPAHLNARRVCDLDFAWPSISVVVNAHNAEDTLEECLSHCDQLDYPRLEVIVVDDGSTDATPQIARAHAGVRLVTVADRGLSACRNLGCQHARGELVAYLDADAYPSPDWPWYLAFGALGDRVGGAGGPNVPPPDEPTPARVVALSPGGPVPRLLTPDRAAHLPGCNMAFRREVLEQLGGFDPTFDAAADDVELEWRLMNSGYELGYHPAALVWHHRRPGGGPLPPPTAPLRTKPGHAGVPVPGALSRWASSEKALAFARPARTGATRSGFCRVNYLSLARDQTRALELAHQWGMPAVSLFVMTAPLGLLRRRLAARGRRGRRLRGCAVRGRRHSGRRRQATLRARPHDARSRCHAAATPPACVPVGPRAGRF